MTTYLVIEKMTVPNTYVPSSSPTGWGNSYYQAPKIEADEYAIEDGYLHFCVGPKIIASFAPDTWSQVTEFVPQPEPELTVQMVTNIVQSNGLNSSDVERIVKSTLKSLVKSRYLVA